MLMYIGPFSGLQEHQPVNRPKKVRLRLNFPTRPADNDYGKYYFEACSMKIDSTYTNPTTASEQRSTPGNQRQIEPAVTQTGTAVPVSPIANAPHADGSDTAKVSGATLSISALAAQLQAVPDVSESRVEALRNSIAEGKYEISPERIAESMLARAIRKLP